jgi:hypothetical protein
MGQVKRPVAEGCIFIKDLPEVLANNAPDQLMTSDSNNEPVSHS